MTPTLTIGTWDATCETTELRTVVGRRTVTDEGRAGYTAAKVENPPPCSVGAVCTIYDQNLRHAGRLTDVDAAHPYGPDDPTMVASVVSMGPLARWGRVKVGDAPWPVETVRARAHRIAALIGADIVVQGGDQLVIARDVDRQPAIDLLRQLASSTGGWVFDHAGSVYLQALDSRGGTIRADTWDDEPAAAWDDLDPLLTWADDTGHLTSLELGCDELLWEPVWSQTSAPLASTVRVTWGDPESDYVLTDQAVEDVLGGPVELHLRTALAQEPDAATLAAVTLARVKEPRWGLDQVEVWWDDLQQPNRDALARALPGARVTITGLPQPAPAAGYGGVLEGWQEDWSSAGRRVLLWLSDLHHSLTQTTWDDEPAVATWDDLDQLLTWEEDIR